MVDKCRDKLHQIILSESNLDRSSNSSISKYIADFEMQEFVSREFGKLVKDSCEDGNEIWAASLALWFPKTVYLILKSVVVGENPSWRSILYSLKCPGTFVFGEKSLPDPNISVLTEHGIQIEIVRGAGHSMAWENPEGLAYVISSEIQSAE